MDFASRPRLIDRLRLFHLFRRHFGNEDAEAVVDALQDEFSPVAPKGDLTQLYEKVATDLVAFRAEMKAEINAAIVKMVGASVLIAGVALAIARLT